jgi:ABC-2 type transport system permease protein
MYQYINFARSILLDNQVPSAFQFLITLLCSVVALVIGILFFRSKQDKFIYYI